MIRFGREIGEDVGSGVRRHLLQDFRGLFGIELLDDLRGQARVEFCQHGRRGLFIERGDDGLALGSGNVFHDVREVRGVEVLELLVGDAQLDAAQGVRLDQVDEFPANQPGGQFFLETPDGR